jgi:imidazolonepropionase
MARADLVIYNAGQLVTSASEGKPKRGRAMRDVGIIEDGAVAIANGKIVAVGRSQDLLRQFEAESDIDAGGLVVCPGFVDPHTHVVYAGERLDEFELKIKGAAYLEILAAGGGILSTVRATRATDSEALFQGAMRRLDRMLQSGTTTCEIKTGYGLDAESEMKLLRVIERLDAEHVTDIVPTLLAAHAVPPEFSENPAGFVGEICDSLLPEARKWFDASRFAASGRQFFCDVFIEKGTFGIEESAKLFSTAKSLGFGLKAHVDQFTNLGGTRLAVEFGAASVDHLDTVSDEEIKLLARSNTIGTVIPTENFNAAKAEFAPARRMIDSGCAVALSTDYNPGSAPCPSMPMAMAIACRYQKLLPAEAFCAATINAAYSIQLGHYCGSIEIGKVGDLLILDARDYREAAYEFGGRVVDKIVKAGKLLS